jgi:hypothetical protein
MLSPGVIYHPEAPLDHNRAQGRLAGAGRFRHSIEPCSPFTFDQHFPNQLADLAQVETKRNKWPTGYRFRSSP